MKYIAIFDDSMLSNFRLDDGGLTLVIQDKRGYNRGVALKPIIRPVLTVTEDCGGSETSSIYLTEGHINAMKKYDEIKTIWEDICEECFECPKYIKNILKEADNDRAT